MARILAGQLSLIEQSLGSDWNQDSQKMKKMAQKFRGLIHKIICAHTSQAWNSEYLYSLKPSSNVYIHVPSIYKVRVSCTHWRSQGWKDTCLGIKSVHVQQYDGYLNTPMKGNAKIPRNQLQALKGVRCASVFTTVHWQSSKSSYRGFHSQWRWRDFLCCSESAFVPSQKCQSCIWVNNNITC